MFFTSEIPRTNNDILGFMPRKKQFGFVFSTSGYEHTLAHELGHGVFGLEHSKIDTDLLMHESSDKGENFTHMDWDTMHAAGFKLYLFDSDDDGELNNPNCTWEEFVSSTSPIIIIGDIVSEEKVLDKVYKDFDKLLTDCSEVKVADKEVKNIEDWSVRGDAQFSKRKGKVLFDRILLKI